MEKYTIDEYKKLVELGVKYKELEEHNRLVVLPCPLETMVYQVVPQENGKGKKVMPCLFTLKLIDEYGKTVFGTEPEAIVASVS